MKNEEGETPTPRIGERERRNLDSSPTEASQGGLMGVMTTECLRCFFF